MPSAARKQKDTYRNVPEQKIYGWSTLKKEKDNSVEKCGSSFQYRISERDSFMTEMAFPTQKKETGKR